MNIERIVDRLKKDEGFRAVAYWDNDQWTYGYGTKAEKEGDEITKERADIVLRARVSVAVSEFRRLFSSVYIDDVRSEAIVNMLFNLGLTKFMGFPKLNEAIYARDWGHAAFEAFNSHWFMQLRKKGLESIERSERIVWELLTGEKG